MSHRHEWIYHTKGPAVIEDGAFAQGSVTRVQRVGETIRRPTGPWTPAVHALLRHLDAVGFRGAPRVLGIDDAGREVLSLLHGEVALRPWPAIVRDADGVAQLATMLRAYHDAVRSFVPPADARWSVPDLRWSPGQIVRHADLGPWNTVWRGNTLVGCIDWDSAEPGSALDDVAQLAWYCVPLRDDAHAAAAGFATAPDGRARLHTLCAAYGVAVADVLAALPALQQREIDRTVDLAARGREPWVTFHARGDVEQIRYEQAWLQANLDQLGEPSTTVSQSAGRE